MSLCPSIEKFKLFLNKKSDDITFISKSFMGYRNKAKDLFSDPSLVINHYKLIRDNIANLRFENEDSHILMYYDLESNTYISKIRFDNDGLINSIVEEIYNPKNNVCIP